MSLARYKQKRNFAITPEPEGEVGRKKRRGLAFVIQKHAATRLHYDFRLELDGVLLSWAVPKGPSLDPNDKRLAMHVEDHPLEYGDFEGVIPARQYGAGTVMLWDRGIWMPREDPREGYAKGRLKFELQGEKLHGTWNLVRSRSAKYEGDTWLLFKEADEFARLHAEAAIVDALPDSVATGRSLEEIKADGDRVWHSNRSVAANVQSGAVARPAPGVKGLARIKGARKAPMPELIEPQLASLVKVPPVGTQWVHEVKYDGYRMLCRISDGEARMMSRNRKDWTDDFAVIARAAARLPVKNAWLDGEVVVVDDQGRSSFQALQNVLSMSDRSRLLYFAFDLPYVDGYDLRDVPLLERKRLLRELLENAPGHLRYSEHFDVAGADFFRSACELGLEGMVSKRVDCQYRAHRSAAWLKMKCLRRQAFVVGGFTDPGGSRFGFGALLLGLRESDGRLTYVGKVGTGFDDRTLQVLRQRLDTMTQAQIPFENPPTGADARKAHWVKPVLVAEVSYTEWTNDGTLRHPCFLGLRDDKVATEIVREAATSSSGDERDVEAPREQAAANASTTSRTRSAKEARAGGTIAGVTLTNPYKVLYAEANITKRDLALYYERVGSWMLPHLAHRPLTLVRCPNGWNQGCFYQKNAEVSANSAISRVKIDGSDGKVSYYMMANSVTAIVALLQLGALELHPWGSQAPKLGFPDRLIFDLDPADDVEWERLVEAAHLVKTLLENIGLCAFLKTTGGKGLHVVLPIEPTVRWEHAKNFTKAVAELLERTFPDRFTSKILKVSRHGKIFIDYLRNAEGATAVAAYSVRAKADAPVSVPIEWQELDADVRYTHFTIRNVPARLAKLKRDPWHDIRDKTHILTKAAMLKVGYKPT